MLCQTDNGSLLDRAMYGEAVHGDVKYEIFWLV
jgi:hypothetical protein